MSNQQHTPEPWIAGDDEDSDYYLVGPHDGDGIVYQPVVKLHSEANARRIVACVNWCAGNSTEGMVLAVEIGRPYAVERDNAIARELELIAQRDELLAALKRAEIVVDIASDWMTEIEMPVDGWVPVSSELNRIRKTVAEIDRNEVRDDSQKQGY